MLFQKKLSSRPGLHIPVIFVGIPPPPPPLAVVATYLDGMC